MEGGGPADHTHRSSHRPPNVVSPRASSTPPPLEPSIEHLSVSANEGNKRSGLAGERGARDLRSIRSFVMRSGRITEAQQRALDSLWPHYGIDFEPGPLDFTAVFGRQAPITLEIGFGNGDNLTALAIAHPERNYLGVEVHRPGVGRLLLGLEEARLSNTRVICHDAVEVLTYQVAPQTLDEVLILFPDPWPKKRQHKRRLVQPPYAQ
jgi:tRNA G46 methylase TrmB